MAFIVISLGAGLGGWLAMISAVTNWFIRHRALALSIAMSGTHFGGFLVPILALGIESYGFEKVALGIGVLLLVIALPVGRLIRNSPEEYGLLPDGDRANPEPGETTPPKVPTDSEPKFTTREALRTRAFWFITIAHIASAVPIVTLSIHLVPKLTDIGLSLSMAGVVVAISTAIALPVQFLSGYMGDRFPKPPLNLWVSHPSGRLFSGTSPGPEPIRGLFVCRPIWRRLRWAHAVALLHTRGVLWA